MLFNTIEYFLFLIIVFFVYWTFKKKFNVQNIFLLITSYYFYSCWDYKFLSLIIISTISDYYISLWIHKSTKESLRKRLLYLSLCINLGFLFLFKYYNFFIKEFNQAFNQIGLEVDWVTLNIVLPVGISFYTFQTLSYTIDVYKKELEPTKNIISFAAYVSFFPQLVAGPIERASNLLPQFLKRRNFDYNKAIDGTRQILWGLFKKVVIANNCAIFVDAIFSNYASLNGVILIIGAILFAFQIYGDFSGYSDIAIGTGKLLGFNLMQNFATPYFSRDIAEFWRRWHISLSTWFRDYLYIPLGGSRVNQILKVRNIFAIFLVSGFWHGANWTFIVWGGIHAMCYLPQIFLKTNRKFLGVVAENQNFPDLLDSFRMLITFTIVTFAWIFFRSNSISNSIYYIKNIFSYSEFNFTQNLVKLKLDYHLFFAIILFIGLLLIVEWCNRQKKHGLAGIPSNFFLRKSFYFIIVLLILEFFINIEEFIYFQF